MTTAGELLTTLLPCPECRLPLNTTACGAVHAALKADPTRHPLVLDALTEALRESDARIAALVEASSLGTPEAKAARESVPPELGRALALVATHAERLDYRGDSLGCSCGAPMYRGHLARVIADALTKAGQNRSGVSFDPEDHDRVALLNIRFHRGKSRSDVENMQAALREFLADETDETAAPTHSTETAEPAPIVVHIDPPRPPSLHPCDHGHRWAWAQLVTGGVRQVCRVCGRERR